MGRITAASLERVREATDLVALVGGYVSLKRAGRNYKGLCPFHDEKTPSFVVTPDRGRYRCFGCGATGSAFDFLMEIDRVAFREAAEILAQRAGVSLDVEEGEDDRDEPRTAKNDLFRVNRWAAEFFRRRLADPDGAACRAYLASRGLDPATWERFGIGWAPASWDALTEAARRRGISDALLIDAGLAKEREGKPGIYDRFRDRLMFPIRDGMERVVAFGGRCLDGSEPKYLNSPETSLFSKRRCLFGIDQLRGVRQGEPIYVMEGYTDVAMAAQVGCRTAVATLGTSLTEEHARQLARYSDHVVLVFDGDAAGRKAAERGAEIFGSVDLDLRISRLPGGEDPCDFLRRTGSAGLADIDENGADFFDFVCDEVRSRHELDAISGKVRAADELLKLARPVQNPVKRSIVMDRISQVLGLKLEDLERRLREDGAARRRPGAGETAEAAAGAAPEAAVAPAQRRAERQILRSLLTGSADPAGPWRGRVRPDDLVVPAHRRLFERALAALDRDGTGGLEAFMLGIEDAAERELANRLVGAEAEGERDRVLFEGAIVWLERRRAQREIDGLKTRAADESVLEDITARLRARHGDRPVAERRPRR